MEESFIYQEVKMFFNSSWLLRITFLSSDDTAFNARSKPINNNVGGSSRAAKLLIILIGYRTMHGSLRCIRSLPHCLLGSHKDSDYGARNLNSRQTIILIIHNHCLGWHFVIPRATIRIIVGRIEPNDSQLPVPRYLINLRLC